MYELRVPDVLRANEETQDEYILENNFAKVIRRVNEDGTTKVTPEEVVIGKYTIYVAQGDNTITIQNYNASIEAVFVQQNAYTDQFATKVEMKSSMNLEAELFNVELKKKVDNNDYTGAEILLKINKDESQAKIKADKIKIERSYNGKW